MGARESLWQVSTTLYTLRSVGIWARWLPYACMHRHTACSDACYVQQLLSILPGRGLHQPAALLAQYPTTCAMQAHPGGPAIH